MKTKKFFDTFTFLGSFKHYRFCNIKKFEVSKYVLLCVTKYFLPLYFFKHCSKDIVHHNSINNSTSLYNSSWHFVKQTQHTPTLHKTINSKLSSQMKISFILADAHLTYLDRKAGKGGEVLDINTHKSVLLELCPEKANDFRPDILHRSLLVVIDSLLNKKGLVKSIVVHTHEDVFIEVDPRFRPPRTYRRFLGVLARFFEEGQLLDQSVEKFPLMQFVDANRVLGGENRMFVGLSRLGEEGRIGRLNEFKNFLTTKKEKGVEELVFVVGMTAHRSLEKSWLQEKVSMSTESLKSSYVLSKLVIFAEDFFEVC